MSETVGTFIRKCAKNIYDDGLNSVTAQEWFDILNSESSELAPEIGYVGTKTDTMANLYAANNEYQLDMSGISGLLGIKEVYLIENSKEFPFKSWIFHEDTGLFEFQPVTSKVKDMAPADYTSYKIIYFTSLPEYTSAGDIMSLVSSKLQLLRKVCVREAISRVLNDHIKLDRYRTLYGRANEYALMAMKDRYTTEIELKKRKLVDTNPLRAF